MPCGGTASRIDDKREEPGSIAPHPDMPANSIAAAGLAGNRSNQILAGIAGTQPEPASFSASRPTRCTCEWYVETIEKTSHFATFPSALIEPCILAGCPRGGTVIDPFAGAGTTGLVADRLGRDAILIELNPAYSSMTRNRIANDAPLFVEFANAAD
jgi:hypothetical protein